MAAVMRTIVPLCVLVGCFVPAAAQQRASFIAAETPLSAASSRPAAEIGRDYLRAAAASLNLSDEALNGVFVAKEYKTAHNGVTHVLYRQQFQGLEVYNAAWVTNVDASGRVLSAGGILYGIPGPMAFPGPAASQRAARAAVLAVNPELGARFTASPGAKTPSRAGNVVFAAGGLGADVEGRLVWYGHRGSLTLAWVFDVLDSDGVSLYSVVVEEATGAVLDKQAQSFSFQAPRGLVFDKGSPQPVIPAGTVPPGPPPVVDRVLVSFAGDLQASPAGWTSRNETAGNNVVAGQNLLGQSFITPEPTRAPGGDFSFPLTLGPNAPATLSFADAVNTNFFYWLNRAHDLHYQNGFDEAAGNFQASNFGRGGVEGDAVLAYSHFGAAALGGPALRNAVFSGGADDGTRAFIAMFLGYSAAGGYFTDSALDAEIILHEYTHGVSRRLVPLGYSTFQGAAMGEGWSDFFALEYLLPDGAPPDGVYPAAQYYFAAFGNGLRTRPYSTRTDVNPLTYANLGAVDSRGPEVHADGEIWMEALLELRANLIQQFGEAGRTPPPAAPGD